MPLPMIDSEGDVMTHAENFTLQRKPVPRYGPWQLIKGQSPTGYGSKIPTDWMLKFDGEKRSYRVYAICFSNVATPYVIRGGQQLIIRGCDFPA